MNYFFVFQNKSYSEEFSGGYLWAPQQAKDGRRVSHHIRMKEVRKGDLIIHSYRQAIVAISIAETNCFESERPDNLSTDWDISGWQVNTKYYTIRNPMSTSEHIDTFMLLQPPENAPFNITKRGNTGYLYCATRKMAEYIIENSIFDDSSFENQKLNILQSDDYDDVHNELDNQLINDINAQTVAVFDENIEYVAKPETKPEAIDTPSGRAYPRSRKVASRALNRAKHNCEIDETHESFIRKNSDKKYVEPHHLIPMAQQDYFKYSIDIEANIVALCSNCHNQIHYGKDSSALLKSLYDKRIDELKRAGIKIDFEQLLNLY